MLPLLKASASAQPVARRARSSISRITGLVRDNQGRPLANALVSLLRQGNKSAVQQTHSQQDGTFSAQISPGRYIIRAAAAGFMTSVTSAVQVDPSAELVYRFDLEPASSGQTVPAQRRDRNDPKWRLRSAQNHRSIFQVTEDEESVAEIAEVPDAAAKETVISTDDPQHTKKSLRVPHGVIETYYTASANQAYSGGSGGDAGVNFAVATPITDEIDLLVAGQVGNGGRLRRAETTARMRAGERHRPSISIAGAHGYAAKDGVIHSLDQVSLRAIDEWVVRDGVVVVLGFDYSRFVGAGANADSFSPRFGLQFDANRGTRLKAAYAPGGSEAQVQSIAEFEDGAAVFRQPSASIAFVDGQPMMEQSRRLEFGVERVLGESSSLEATAFFDTTDGRGVGLLQTPIRPLSNNNSAELLNVAHQQGAARGLRVVYARRIGGAVKASAGYSFGRGQQLAAPEGDLQPAQIFGSGFFQTVAAQLDAALGTRTHVRTVVRFSPRAAVFAIDPFAGRLAVYDPSLSIALTRELPTFGLPVRAEAIIDARNMLDTQTSADDGETLISVGTTRRSVRGGISVRF